MGGYQNDPGTPQQEAGFGFLGRFWTESFHNLTASTTHTQAGATPIDSMFNTVAVNNPGDSVVLPSVASFPGGALIICVQNISANAMQVFAQGSDTINGAAGSSGLSQMGNSIVYYQCTQPGVWQAVGLGSGFATGANGAMVTYSTLTGLTASPTHTQAAATLVTAMQNQISVCATLNDCIRLPPAQPGMEITVVNNGAQSAAAFPSSAAQGGVTGGDTILPSAQNAVLNAAIAAGAVTIFYCFVAGTWVFK